MTRNAARIAVSKSLLIFLLCASSVGLAFAQAYPNRPLKLILPSPVGSPADNIARPIAEKLGEALGQPVIIESHDGANGNIGANMVAKALPDGYTLLQISTAFTISPSTYAKLPFDTNKDFAPISPIAKSDIVLLINPTIPAKTVREFIDLARKRERPFSYASSGNGSSIHLAGELMKSVAGIDMLHVPYKGVVQGLTDLMGGHVDLMFIGLSGALPHIKTGKVRALAIASPNRVSAQPDLPTISEAGYPGLEVGSSFGLITTAGTPKDVIARLSAAMMKILSRPEMSARFAPLGVEPMVANSAEFTTYLEKETAKWAKAVKAANIKPE